MSNSIVYCLVIFLLFLLQFVYFPVGVSFFEGAKVYASEIGIGLLLLIQILRGKLEVTEKKKLFLFLLGIIVLLSCFHLWITLTDYTFWGNEFRMQGTLLIWFLLLFGFLSSSLAIKRIAPLFVLAVLFVQFFLSFWVESGILERAIGSVGEPNSLAAVMLFVWPFFYFSLHKKQWKIVGFLLAMVLVGLTILFAGSRSGLVALGIQLVFFMAIVLGKLPLKHTVIACVCLLVISFTLPFLVRGNVYENRGEVWHTAIKAALDRPLVGSGFGNTELALHEASIKLNNHLQGYYVDSSHNIFLDWWVQGGLGGLLIFLYLIFNTFSYFVMKKDVRNLVVLLGLLAALSFNPGSVVLLVQLWWLIGQSFDS